MPSFFVLVPVFTVVVCFCQVSGFHSTPGQSHLSGKSAPLKIGRIVNDEGGRSARSLGRIVNEIKRDMILPSRSNQTQNADTDLVPFLLYNTTMFLQGISRTRKSSKKIGIGGDIIDLSGSTAQNIHRENAMRAVGGRGGDRTKSARSLNSCPKSGLTLTDKVANVSNDNYRLGDSCTWIISPGNGENVTSESLIEIQFPLFDFNPFCDRLMIFRCTTSECAGPDEQFSYLSWRKPTKLTISGSTVMVLFTSDAYSWCSSKKSLFLLSYRLLCPQGFYGIDQNDCKPCRSTCDDGKLLLGSCSAGTVSDTTFCGCPAGQYSSNSARGATCFNCSSNCSEGIVDITSLFCFCSNYMISFTQVKLSLIFMRARLALR
jgi:hypothetical protein